jgi:SAM-dependent methyltransferase
MIFRPCPICSLKEGAFFLQNKMATIGGLDMSYTVVCCRQCGFYYAEQLADANTFNTYYETLSKYDTQNALSRIDQARIDFGVKFLNSKLSNNSHVLDVGCGVGALLEGLKRVGWKHLQGIDPAPNAAKRALEIYGLSGIKTGNITNAHKVINLKELNLVCIMSVLEHLPYLNQDIKQLLSHLSIGCKILIEVPAIEFFPNLSSEPFGEFSLEHIQYFDVPSLNKLMQSIGASPLAIELLELPMASSGVIMGLFELRGTAPLQTTYNCVYSKQMETYREQSKQKLGLALNRIPAGPLIIYGAGSHTARLLPHLERMHHCTIHSIVDSNPNLIGKKIGTWTIKPTEEIYHTPEIPVLVSSFKSQKTIEEVLHKFAKNKIVLMYE